MANNKKKKALKTENTVTGEIDLAILDEVNEESLELSENMDVETETEIFLSSEGESIDGFLPEVEDSADEFSISSGEISEDLAGTELEGFEAAEIEELEFVAEEQVESIVESILFASDRPVSFASIQQVFKGTNVKREKIKRALEALAVEYAGGRRGVTLDEVTGGYQIRTKVDNMNFLKRTIKARTFKLSGPALETLAIVAYKQPVIKMEIDQIRGVESGHLLRALMEKGLVNFEGKAETLPGKPMQYGTTRKFLEIFGLRNLKELPTLSQIDELLPEGIGEEQEEKPTLSMVTDSMAEEVKTVSYSQGEEELGLIEEQLGAITTSSDFFEQEKQRQKMKRDEEKAQNIREAVAVGEAVAKKDLNWLKRYEEGLLNATTVSGHGTSTAEGGAADSTSEVNSGSSSSEVEDEKSGLKMDSLNEDRISFEEDDEHIEDEIPFYEEADEEKEGSV